MYTPTKYVYLHVLQGDYGYGYDDLTESENYAEIKNDYQCYRENEPHTAHRIIQRRVLRRTIMEHALCSSCADIALNGYTDAITDPVEHQAQVNRIDKRVLNPGFYWLSEKPAPLTNQDGERCQGCRNTNATVSVKSATDY